MSNSEVNSSLSIKDRWQIAIAYDDVELQAYLLPVVLAHVISLFGAEEYSDAMWLFFQLDSITDFSALKFKDQKRIDATKTNILRVSNSIDTLCHLDEAPEMHVPACKELVQKIVNVLNAIESAFPLDEEEIKITDIMSAIEINQVIPRKDFWTPFRDWRHYAGVRDVITIGTDSIALQGACEPYCPAAEHYFITFIKNSEALNEYVFLVSQLVFFTYSESLPAFNDEADLKYINREQADIKKIRLNVPVKVVFKTSPADDINKDGYTMGIIIECDKYPQLVGIIVSPPIVDGKIMADEGFFPVTGEEEKQDIEMSPVFLVRKSTFSPEELGALTKRVASYN